MLLEELIYKRFVSLNKLTGNLAVYGGMPAVFSPEPPDEAQEEWEGNTQYPMVFYNFY